MTPLANRLAEYACQLRFEDLPAPTVHEVKRRFIDSIATAVALLDGKVGLEQFAPERFTAIDAVEMTARVKVHLDNALTPRYPRGIPNRIQVTLDDGRTFTHEVEFPRGHAMNPMTDAEVEAKFRNMVEPRYGKQKADRILAVCWELEKLKEAGELIRLVS